MHTKKELLTQLKAKSIGYDNLSHGGASAIVVPGKGAKIAFAGVDDENFFWSNETALSKGTSDIGGQRTWVAPEGGPKGSMFSPDWRSWKFEPAYEPGRYFPLKVGPDNALYRNEFDFSSNDGTRFILALDRKMTVQEYPKFEKLGVKGLQIRFRHTLINRGTTVLKNELGLWSLIQGCAERKGSVIIPLKKMTDRPFRDGYFERIPSDRIRISNGNSPKIGITVQGGVRFKIGVEPGISKGIIAGVFPSRTGPGLCLILKEFRIWPNRVYVDKPGSEQETIGDAIQCYNSPESGRDGFFEMECHSPSAVMRPSGSIAHDIDIFCLKGSEESILEVCRKLVSPDLDLMEDSTIA